MSPLRSRRVKEAEEAEEAEEAAQSAGSINFPIPSSRHLMISTQKNPFTDMNLLLILLLLLLLVLTTQQANEREVGCEC